MKKVAICGLAVMALASFANAGTVNLELRFNGTPGLHELTLQPSQNATIELWASITGDVVASATVMYDIQESAPGDFTILSREVNAGFYDLSGPVTGPSTIFHGLGTGIGAGSLDGTFLVERFMIHCEKASEDVISVVATNPVIPGQTTTFNNATGEHTTVLPASLTLHQIPEPASLALLALGGLLAIRRR